MDKCSPSPGRGKVAFQAFREPDFMLFQRERQRSTEYNPQRLRLRRNLEALGLDIAGQLQAAGLELIQRTSLHHPYTYNRFAVASQWLYYSRPKRAFQELKRILGPALGRDLDTAYTHTLLVVAVDEQGMELGLKIHQQAWWDGQNLKNKCQQVTARQELLQKFRQLTGFHLRLHDWQREYPCDSLASSDLSTFMRYYTPGKHWLHVYLSLTRCAVISMGTEFSHYAGQQMASLAPLYRFIAWSPDNNALFRSK